MSRPVEDWADWKYQPHHAELTTAHAVPFGREVALCGAVVIGLDGWYGTGDWDEIETAALLPRCAACIKAAS